MKEYLQGILLLILLLGGLTLSGYIVEFISNLINEVGLIIIFMSGLVLSYLLITKEG